MKNYISTLILVFGYMFSPLSADTLMLDVIQSEPENSTDGVMRPIHGMKMTQVFQRFGSPYEERPSVGLPAITRWVYDDFTVYFENDIVLRSVINR